MYIHLFRLTLIPILNAATENFLESAGIAANMYSSSSSSSSNPACSCSMLTPGLAMAMLQIYKWKFRQEHFLLNFRIRFLTIARLSHSTRKFSCQSLCLCLPLWAPSYPPLPALALLCTLDCRAACSAGWVSDQQFWKTLTFYALKGVYCNLYCMCNIFTCTYNVFSI